MYVFQSASLRVSSFCSFLWSELKSIIDTYSLLFIFCCVYSLFCFAFHFHVIFPQCMELGNQKKERKPANSIQIAVACELVSTQSGANFSTFILNITLLRCQQNKLLLRGKSCFQQKYIYFCSLLIRFIFTCSSV